VFEAYYRYFDKTGMLQLSSPILVDTNSLSDAVERVLSHVQKKYCGSIQIEFLSLERVDNKYSFL